MAEGCLTGLRRHQANVGPSTETNGMVRLAITSLSCFVLALVALSPLGGTADAAVFWGDNSGIGRVNLDGSYPEPAFIAGEVPAQGDVLHNIYRACGVAVDGSHIYWADSGGNRIGRANLDGSDSDFNFISGADQPCGVAVDSSHVYWANSGSDSLGRANLDGSEVNQELIGGIQPCGVAVEEPFVYWASPEEEAVGRAAASGPAFVQRSFVREAFGACGVAVDGSYLYWGTFSKDIGRVNLDGSEPDRSFITGLDRPCGVAVNSSRIFWTEDGAGSEGRVGEANLEGGEVNDQLVTGLAFPCGVAVDSTAYVPPVAPKVSSFSIRRVKHDRRSHTAFVAVSTGEEGVLSVRLTRGARWRLQPAIPSGLNLAPGKSWLRIWPDGRHGAGRKLLRLISRRGKVRMHLTLTFTASGAITSRKHKRLWLVGAREKRRERHAKNRAF